VGWPNCGEQFGPDTAPGWTGSTGILALLLISAPFWAFSTERNSVGPQRFCGWIPMRDRHDGSAEF
jgi:hypothetical protein